MTALASNSYDTIEEF